VCQRMGNGFVREYLNTSACDLLIGIPTAYGAVLTTRPYYRSTYVFVVDVKRSLKPQSLDDPALQGTKIGIQALEEDYAPPAQALIRRGMQTSIVPFRTVGNQADSIIRAVADHNVDTAIVWGPLAGYFAAKYKDLAVMPVTPVMDALVPLTFAISMGVRKGNETLRDELQDVLTRSSAEIQEILSAYHVPQLDLAANIAANGAPNVVPDNAAGVAPETVPETAQHFAAPRKAAN
jgi:mxaJ protein